MTKTNYRWFIVALAFCGLVINIIDRTAMAYAIKPIEMLFHINNTYFGILSSSFSLGYMIMVMLGGIIIDRIGARSVWCVTAIIWSLATLCLGFSSGFLILFLLRLITGAAEGPTGPSIMKAITTYLSPRERGFAFGVIIMASPVSSVIGAPLCSFLIINFSWKVMFVVLGVLGIVWGIIWYIYYRNDPREISHISQAELNIINSSWSNSKENNKEIEEVSLKFLLTNGSLWLNNYAFFAYGYLHFFAVTWLPGYLMQEYGLSLSQIGVLLMIPWLFTSILMLLFGYISDKIFIKTNSVRLSATIIVSISFVISAISFLPMIKMSSLPVLILSLSLALGFGLAPGSCFYALNAHIAKNRASTSVAIMIIFLALAGITSPIITGWVSTITHNFKGAMYIMLFLNLSSGLLLFLLQKPDKYLNK